MRRKPPTAVILRSPQAIRGTQAETGDFCDLRPGAVNYYLPENRWDPAILLRRKSSLGPGLRRDDGA